MRVLQLHVFSVLHILLNCELANKRILGLETFWMSHFGSKLNYYLQMFFYRIC